MFVSWTESAACMLKHYPLYNQSLDSCLKPPVSQGQSAFHVYTHTVDQSTEKTATTNALLRAALTSDHP